MLNIKSCLWMGTLVIALGASLASAGGPENSGKSKAFRNLADEGKVVRYGLGFTTISALPALGIRPSFTGLMVLNNDDLVQLYFSYPTSNPVAFGVGGLYKHVLFGDRSVGFHVGGGLSMGIISAYGTNNVLSFSLAGVAGLHFQIPGLSQLAFHLDGGPSFTYQNTAQFSSNFQVDSFSSGMGLSALYLF